MTGLPCSLFDFSYYDMNSQLLSECIRMNIFDEMFADIVTVAWTLPPTSEFLLMVV